MLQHRQWQARQICLQIHHLRGGVEAEKKKATPSNAEPIQDNSTEDPDDEFEEDTDLIDDREGKPMLATRSDAEEDDEDLENDAELATSSDAEEGLKAAILSDAEEEMEIELTFDANGGELTTGGTTITNTVTLPAEISIPSVVSRPGYILTGWYTKPEGGERVASRYSEYSYVDTERLHGTTTLYAQWEELSYTVTFMNGYTQLKSVKVKSGDCLEIPEDLNTYDDSLSYYIKGWSMKSTQGSELYDFSQPVTGNVTLYAQKADRTTICDSNNWSIWLKEAYYPYTGKPIEDVIDKVRYTFMPENSGWTTLELVEGEDYTVSYENNASVGTGTVTIRGIHKYQGTLSTTFEITQAYLNSAEILFQDSSNGVYSFTGKSIRPDITVKVGDAVLTEGVDYKVVSDWPKNVGTHSVRLQGLGSYTGIAYVNMEIVASAITEERKASLNYYSNVYLHVGDSISLIDAEPESALASVGYYEAWSGTDSSLFALKEDGSLTALKEGETDISPVVYWKDGDSTPMVGVHLCVLPDSKKIVTVKTILPEGSYYDGTKECVYTSPTDQDIYFKSLNSMEDKVFQGWYNEEGTKITDSVLRNPDKNMTLYGKYARKITLHFDYGEGMVKSDSYKKSELAEGESTWLMTGNNTYAYEREGYILVGWCLDPECEGEVLTGNYTPKLADGQSEVTLYAKWEQSYQISFDPGEGYFLYDRYADPIAVQAGHSVSNILPQDPVSTTATFDGWFTEDGVRVTKSYVPTGDVKLYAHWLKNKTCRVTFHANGAYFRDNEKADETDPTTATRQVQEGYPTSIFVYRQNYNCQWYKDSDFTIPYNMDAAVTEDLDLYARWVRQLRLSWDADGGVDTSGRDSGYTSFDEGSACSIPTVTKEGFRFDGWYTEDGTLITKQTLLNENMSIKARWMPAQVHVSLDLDGGELASYYDQTELYVNPGDRLATVINGAPRKEGAAFAGWLAEDGSRYDGLYWITASADQTEMKLKAEWTTDYVTVTFDAEDSSMYDEFSMEYTNRLSYRVPKNQACPQWMYSPSTETVGNRAIKGWTKVQGTEDIQDVSEMVFTEDTVLHPVWSAYWRLSFDFMGGFYHSNSQNQMSRIIAKGQKLTYPGANQMVRPGYRFDGWYETVDYSGEKFDPPFVPERSMLLYAKWVSETAQSYKVTFCTDPNDETAKKLVYVISAGDCVNKPADPVKEDQVFGGWYQDAECRVAYDFATTVSGDIILYAKWTRVVQELDEENTRISLENNGTVYYDGSEQKPKLSVKMSGKTLTENVDYTVIYQNNVEVGIASVIITGKGNYSGTVTKTFQIMTDPYDIRGAEILVNPAVYDYTGEEITPEVTVYIKNVETGVVITLSQGRDYTLSYANNINTGQGTVTITGTGKYHDKVEKTFMIEKVENPIEAVEPTFAAVYSTKLETLKLPDGWSWRDTDAFVGDVGEHEIEIYLAETKNYKEKVSYAKVIVERKQSSQDMLKADLSQITFTGNEAKPDITLTDGAYVLREGVDYEISYRNNLHAGTAAMILTFKGNYSGSLEQEFTIEQAEMEITIGVGSNLARRLQDGAFALEATTSGDGELQYTSSNPAVAMIDEEGVVTPVGVGTTILTAIYLGDADHKPAAVSVELTVTKTADISSGRDHSDSGSGSFGGGSAAEQTIIYQGISLPSYVNVRNQWQLLENGTWNLICESGEAVRDQWMAVYNPYADASCGQQAYNWYRFDENGTMLTGWYTDENGDTYYLNPTSDHTKGGMKEGWVEIDGKWYYFNTVTDGSRGKLLKNTTTPDGYHVREDGSWDGLTKK